MNYRIKTFIFSALFSTVFMSCQDTERGGNEVEILSQEEKTGDIIEGEMEQGGDSPLQRFADDPDLSSFNRNVTNSGISEEFEGTEGPFTFFAPSNAAYDRLPAQQMEGLSDPRNSSTNRELMKYYMVDGEMTVDWIIEKIEASGNNSYTIMTKNGKELTATMEGENIILTDASGNRAVVEKSAMDERFGVYHTIDNVLWPEGNSSGQVITN